MKTMNRGTWMGVCSRVIRTAARRTRSAAGVDTRWQGLHILESCHGLVDVDIWLKDLPGILERSLKWKSG
jgi:hypothetical protein